MVMPVKAQLLIQGDESVAYPRVMKLSRFQNKDKSLHFHLNMSQGFALRPLHYKSRIISLQFQIQLSVVCFRVGTENRGRMRALAKQAKCSGVLPFTFAYTLTDKKCPVEQIVLVRRVLEGGSPAKCAFCEQKCG